MGVGKPRSLGKHGGKAIVGGALSVSHEAAVPGSSLQSAGLDEACALEQRLNEVDVGDVIEWSASCAAERSSIEHNNTLNGMNGFNGVDHDWLQKADEHMLKPAIKCHLLHQNNSTFHYFNKTNLKSSDYSTCE